MTIQIAWLIFLVSFSTSLTTRMIVRIIEGKKNDLTDVGYACIDSLVAVLVLWMTTLI